jgi:transcriptional regulator with XRE-family HTH domain
LGIKLAILKTILKDFNEEAMDMNLESYTSLRSKAFKRIMRQLREEAGYSQETVARLLECSRTRITERERIESTTEYGIAEIELLATLFGKHPHDILSLTGQHAIELGRLVTEMQTSLALQGVVDCILPKRIEKLYAKRFEQPYGDEEYFPGKVVFSPSGEIIATIVDSFVAEDLKDLYDEPYHLTVMCWDTKTGAVVGQKRLPYIEKIAVLDADRVAIVTNPPLRGDQITPDNVSESSLSIWNLHKDQIEVEMELFDRVGAVAVSPYGTFLAAFMPSTSTIQVWQTSDWRAIRAFKLQPFEDDTTSPESPFLTAIEVQELLHKPKKGPRMQGRDTRRFDFMNRDVLAVSIDERTIELDLRSSSGHVTSTIEYPSKPFSRVSHYRDTQGEIAITSVHYDSGTCESSVEMYYLVPPEKRYPFDSYLHLTKRFAGRVHQFTNVDNACVLGLVSYETPYRWKMSYKQRFGLVNVVSGRAVILNDLDRLRDGDNQFAAHLSPRGDVVAYWVYPYDSEPRLSIQYIDATPCESKDCLCLIN